MRLWKAPRIDCARGKSPVGRASLALSRLSQRLNRSAEVEMEKARNGVRAGSHEAKGVLGSGHLPLGQQKIANGTAVAARLRCPPGWSHTGNHCHCRG